MAQKIITQLVDDIDGTEIEDGEGETVSFTLDGQSYTLDLTNKNADKFRGLFMDYVAVATKVGRKSGGPARPGAKRSGSTNTAEVRAWARSNGWPNLGDRGRIPAEVQSAFDAK